MLNQDQMQVIGLRGIKMNKKAQIGATITWFVALIIVVFVVVLFVLASLGLSKVKGQSSETKFVLSQNLASSKEIFYLMEKTTGVEDKKLVELIVEWADTKDSEAKKAIIEEVESFFKNPGSEVLCYGFFISLDGFDLEEYYTSLVSGSYVSDSPNSITPIPENQVIEITNFPEDKMKVFERTSIYYLYSERNKIKLNFYMGDC